MPSTADDADGLTTDNTDYADGFLQLPRFPCNPRNPWSREPWHREFSVAAEARACEQAVLGDDGIDELIMGFPREVLDDLPREAEADGGAVPTAARKKAIVKSAATAEASAARGEGEAGDEKEIDLIGGDDRCRGVVLCVELPSRVTSMGRIVEADEFHLVAADAREAECRSVFIFP